MSERVEVNYSPGPADGDHVGSAEIYTVHSVQAVDTARVRALEDERDRLLDVIEGLKRELEEARR